MKNKKVIAVSFLIFIFISFLPLFFEAHSGKTDFKGGHFDNNTGEYHYHHGYPAHKHTNGNCPYDFNDKTEPSDKKKSESSKKDSDDWLNIILTIVVTIFIIIPGCIFIIPSCICIIFDIIKAITK